MKSPLSARRFLAGLLLAAACIFLSPSASGAPRFVVKIANADGSILIAGDSAEPGHEGWIDARAFGQGINRPAGEVFVGTSRFTFHKNLDAASPYLALAVAKGKSIPKVMIQYLGDGGSGNEGAVACVELNHVRVTGCRVGTGSFNPLGPSGDGRPVEEVTLVWSEVVLHYQGAEPAGFAAHESTEDPSFDDDGDGIPNDKDPDDDNDKIDDRYEVANELDPFADDAAGDLDGDRQSNFDEAVADTRANDGRDFFRIDSLIYRTTADGPQAIVTLTAKPGRQYTLKATSDLALPRESWFTVDHFEVAADDEAGPVEIVLSGPMVANAGRLFFAAEVDTTAAP